MNLASKIIQKVLPSRLALMAAASAGTLGLVGLVAFASAAIPSGDGKINGCYGKYTGYLRVIDPAKETCQKLEVPISWNQASVGEAVPGPVGPTGPIGPTGPQGPAGTGGGVASLDDLDGIDCTRPGGEAGVLSITHGQNTSILFDCGPISTCGDDAFGDLPTQAVSIGSVSGDDPNHTGPVSITGIICPGDVDYFTASITESALTETLDLEGLVRIQMTPGAPLQVTPSILSATPGSSVTPLPDADISTLDMGVSVPDGPANDFITMQFKVEGAAPHITGPYTLSVYGAGASGTAP